MRTAIISFCLLISFASAAGPRPAFPGAEGWAANTPGGRGGRILRVTTLAAVFAVSILLLAISGGVLLVAKLPPLWSPNSTSPPVGGW